ncbi:MAG: hypothetical protein QOE89_2189, partial [Pseudonocardiales bacterium]|nr:hypothetical protein [Pseudonocardiales bacterium]
ATLVIAILTVCVLGVVLGSLHAYRRWVLVSASIGFLLAITGLRLIQRAGHEQAEKPTGTGPRHPAAVIRNIAFAVLLAANVVEYAWRSVIALRLPPLGYDALYFHLINVEEWVLGGTLGRPFAGLSRVAGDPGALAQADTFPKNTELVAAWIAGTSGSLATVGLTQIAFVALLASSVTGICRAAGISAPSARIAGTLPGLCPVVLAQSSELYTDIARTACVAATFHLLLAAFESMAGQGHVRGRRRVFLVLSGVALGLAVGVKPNNLVFVPVVCAVAGGLVLAEVRASNLGEGGRGPADAGDVRRRLSRTALLLLIPALAVGSYWYIRTWIWWGSPVWPYAEGPFHGRSSFVATDATMQLYYGTSSTRLALLSGWWRALSEFGGQLRGDQRTGGLGLLWLCIGIPTLLLLLFRCTWNRRAVFGAAVPLVLGTLFGPASYSTRYSIPLSAAAAVAVAVVFDRVAIRAGQQPGSLATGDQPTSGTVTGWRPRWPAIVTGVLAVAVVGVSSADAWAATRKANWYLTPARGYAVASLRAQITAVTSDAATRSEYGFAPAYETALARIPSGQQIVFYADHPPQLTYPLTGRLQDHPLRVLPAVGSAVGPAMNFAMGSAMVGGLGATTGTNVYLYLPRDDALIDALKRDRRVQLTGTVWDGVILRLPPS